MWKFLLFLVLTTCLFIYLFASTEPLQIKPIQVLPFAERYIDGSHSINNKFVISDDNLYLLALSDNRFPYSQAKMYAIATNTNEIIWAKQINIKPFANFQNPYFVVKNGFICYRTPEEELCLLDPSTAKEHSRFPGVSSVLEVSNGQIHILDKNWHYAILDGTTGQILNRKDIKGDISTQLLITPQKYYLYNNQLITVRDISSDQVLWEYKLEDDTFSSMEINNGVLYIKKFSSVMAIDQETGQLIWQYSCSGKTSVIEKDFVYVGSSINGKEAVLKLNAKTGEKIKAVEAGLWTGNQPVVMNEIIYSLVIKQHYLNIRVARFLYSEDRADSYNYGLTAIDANTGKTLWTTETTWGESVVMPTVHNNFVYFGVSGINWENYSKIFMYHSSNK